MLDVCLRTLLSSIDVELEIVVVLNGCDEELPDVAHTSSRVHVVTADEPVGFSAANNLGVVWASGELDPPDYYYFINNDTRSEPDSLSLQVTALEDDERAAAAGPTLLIDWARDHLNSLGLKVTDDAWAWDEGIGIGLAEYGPLPDKRPVAAVTGSAILVDAKVHRQVDGWTELYDYYFEDIDLCLKIRGAGYEVIHVPTAVVGHHVSATMTLESDYKNYLFWRNRLLLALVHWPSSLLFRLARIVVVEEILRRPRSENGLQRKALRGTLRKLPRALAARWKNRGKKDWTGYLVPRGSVPVITLPEKPKIPNREIEALVLDPRTWSPAADLVPRAVKGRRVLVLGCSPLPFENQRMNMAPGDRTWQFASALVDDGHAVCVAALRITGAYEPDQPPIDRFSESGVFVTTMEEGVFRMPGVVETLVAVFRPDVVIGASSAVPALRAVEVAGDLPVWIDLFGDLMAEAQARLGVHPKEDLAPYRDVLTTLLDRGDAFSAVSSRQRYSVIGQLGLMGRLNRATRDTELVHVVPCSIRDDPGEPAVRSSPAALEGIEDGDFVVLWSGGFNTWCDVDTLVTGVEKAMSHNDALRLVVTGGSIPGHDDWSFSHFRNRIAESDFHDRFLVKGRLESRELAGWLERADLGVVTEKRLTERILGSSGRVLGWLTLGLPLVCTAVSELGEELALQDLASVYRAGDPDDLARVILEVAAEPEAARDRARHALEHARRHWSVEATTQPLGEWVVQAHRAPDGGLVNPLSLASLIEADRRLPNAEARYHEVRSELGRIHQSTMWRIWMYSLKIQKILGLRGRAP